MEEQANQEIPEKMDEAPRKRRTVLELLRNQKQLLEEQQARRLTHYNGIVAAIELLEANPDVHEKLNQIYDFI